MAVITATHGATQVSAPGGLALVIPTLDTSAYASGDLLFDVTEVPLAVTWDGGYALWNSIEVQDEDAQGQALDLLILSAGTSLGSVNGAFAASDALCRNVVASYSVRLSDYVSLGSGSKHASIGGIQRIVQAGVGSSSLWLAAITRATPTHTASGLRISLGILAG